MAERSLGMREALGSIGVPFIRHICQLFTLYFLKLESFDAMQLRQTGDGSLSVRRLVDGC